MASNVEANDATNGGGELVALDSIHDGGDCSQCWTWKVSQMKLWEHLEECRNRRFIVSKNVNICENQIGLVQEM